MRRNISGPETTGATVFAWSVAWAMTWWGSEVEERAAPAQGGASNVCGENAVAAGVSAGCFGRDKNLGQ